MSFKVPITALDRVRALKTYRESQEPLRAKHFRGVILDLKNIADPQRGDLVTLIQPERGTWVYDGSEWRRMKMTGEPVEPEPESAASKALRRLQTPLKLGKSHGKGHSAKSLQSIENPERGDYAVGLGGTFWVYDGSVWRHMKRKPKT